ncbi:unnamed protein product [Pleuronectes platessa]|uniref:Uncharacterized protein n=1 Tax=Pleuronectes platessa TaxID=8262 RepID=A0A9N7YY37_PLEPL|nr:unnamed protein product [Pleuronectes platessa]
MVSLKEFHLAPDRGPRTAPQPEGEDTQPSHSATKSRADTQGAMCSSTRLSSDRKRASGTAGECAALKKD